MGKHMRTTDRGGPELRARSTRGPAAVFNPKKLIVRWNREVALRRFFNNPDTEWYLTGAIFRGLIAGLES